MPKIEVPPIFLRQVRINYSDALTWIKTIRDIYPTFTIILVMSSRGEVVIIQDKPISVTMFVGWSIFNPHVWWWSFMSNPMVFPYWWHSPGNRNDMWLFFAIPINGINGWIMLNHPFPPSGFAYLAKLLHSRQKTILDISMVFPGLKTYQQK